MSSLVYRDFEGEHDLVAIAVKRIQQMSRIMPLCLRFSGGKDSIVSRKLFDLAGVPYTIIFSKTSVDPPELLQFIKKYHSDVIVDYPPMSMFQLIPKKGFPPTRLCRYCCSMYKERNVCPRDAYTCTGVRQDESRSRRSRHWIEACLLDRGVSFFHPIMEWSEVNVWDFIEEYRLPYPSPYDEGFKRLGCVGCPMTGPKQMEREFRRWPQFEKAYLFAFEKMLEGRQFDKWKTKYDVMEWYIHGAEKRYQQLEGQISLFDGDFYERFRREEWDEREVPIEDVRSIMLDRAA